MKKIYKLKQAEGKWRLYYSKSDKVSGFGNGLVFPLSVAWVDKWKAEKYLERANENTL